ncbi:MAG: hypothetical protein ABIP63_05730 [Thermoanaerobaculia bacterium]
MVFLSDLGSRIIAWGMGSVGETTSMTGVGSFVGVLWRGASIRIEETRTALGAVVPEGIR